MQKENNSGWKLKIPGEIINKWPKDSARQPEPAALLTHCAGVNMEAEMLISMLEAFEIPAFCVCTGDGAFGKLIIGVSGSGMDVYVPEKDLEAAKKLMEAEPDESTL